jgi:hypothetical protein
VTFTVYAQVPAPVTPEALVTAAKRAAGAGHPGTFLRKMTEVAEAAGATVLVSNHTEFDRAYDRARIAQLPRAAGETHPYETDTATVMRDFEMAGTAEAQRLLVQ